MDDVYITTRIIYKVTQLTYIEHIASAFSYHVPNVEHE